MRTQINPAWQEIATADPEFDAWHATAAADAAFEAWLEWAMPIRLQIARLRRMTFQQAAVAGYRFRWSNDRRRLELSNHRSGWRSVQEMDDFNQRYFNRIANLK